MRKPSVVDPDFYIGTVTHVTASQVQINLPSATAFSGERANAHGAVGDFVFIDCDQFKLLGRVIETRIPDNERLTIEPKLGVDPSPNPIGRVQLLAAVAQGTSLLKRGIPAFPKIGDSVYLAEKKVFSELIKTSVSASDELTINIGKIDAADGIDIHLPPEKIFGRHTGIFGATGGGKSWTIALLLQEIKKIGGKAILFDPTGEFTNIDCVDEVYTFELGNPDHKHVHFPYQKITEDDLFSLLRPSGQIQGPKLRDAIKSLKLIEVTNGISPEGVTYYDGLLTKKNKSRAAIFNALNFHSTSIHSPYCLFDISKLPDQIRAECVFSSDFNNLGLFGGIDNNAASHCEPLIARLNTQIRSSELKCLFDLGGLSLVEELEKFYDDPYKDIAIVSFKDIRFEHNTREVILNVIGRHLLATARTGAFIYKPVIVFLDEAHQFLGHAIGDDYGKVRLDSFGLIAKEGRKYGLTCVLATQRPRDIPQDILSQLGTLFVHRLTNQQDRDTIESSCGDLDRGAAQFIPMLAPGEAVLIGPDLPAPLPLFVHPPSTPPNSRGPSYQEFWRRRQVTKLL